MKSQIIKRSVVIAGHKTSVSLEDEFWKALKEIAAEQAMTISQIIASIDHKRSHTNLSSNLRLYVLNHYRKQLGKA